jgi:hypothetical protein
MSTDDTPPARPPASGDPGSYYAPTEARPSFQPAPRPGQRPSSPPQQSYQNSAYPDTVRIGQQPPPPPSRQGDGPGWQQQRYGGQGATPGGYGSPGRYGPADEYGASQDAFDRQGPSQRGFDQQGFGEQGFGQQATAPYGPEPGYGQQPGDGPDGLGPRPTGRRKRRRSGRRRLTIWLSVIVVLLILLVVADRVSVKIAENEIASQITTSDPQIHPSVTIPGFPFLTQVATRDIHEIDLSASNVAAGPVTISSVRAVAKGVHVNGSFNGGKVDTITATVFVGFSSLSSALSSESSGIANLTLSSAGNNDVKASFGVLGTNLLTETGKITLSGNQVTVTWISNGSGDSNGIGSLIGGLTGSGSGAALQPLHFTIPKLPAGVQVKSFTVGTQGITITGGAQNTTLSQ